MMNESSGFFEAILSPYLQRLVVPVLTATQAALPIPVEMHTLVVVQLEQAIIWFVVLGVSVANCANVRSHSATPPVNVAVDAAITPNEFGCEAAKAFAPKMANNATARIIFFIESPLCADNYRIDQCFDIRC